MPVFEDIWARIDRFNISAIARASGLSRGTILDIRHGRTLNPGIVTVEKLEAGLKTLEADEPSSRGKTEEKQRKNRNTGGRSHGQ